MTETPSSDAARFLQLLEQRIELLGSLAAALLAASSDVVAFDLDGLEARIADQERLCSDIRSLDARIDQIQRQCATQVRAAANSSSISAVQVDAARMRDTLARLRDVQARVQQLNSAHQALLRRSRRTANALLNSYHSFAMTYGDPAAVTTSVGERV